MGGKPFESRGCHACRQRKVKCDQQKPQCAVCLKRSTKCPGYDRDSGVFIHHKPNDRDHYLNTETKQNHKLSKSRCTSTGRKCDGYEQGVDKRTREWRESRAKNQNNEALQIQCFSKVRTLVTTVPQPLASACQIDLTWNERWLLDFYQNHTAVRFSHYFQNSFWSGLVLQMCQNHPAVRHAVIAMSAWHTHLERIPAIDKEHLDSSLALLHCTKAIAYLRESLTREIQTPQSSSLVYKKVMLVTCLAFIVLALFQGDVYSARNHLVSGYKIFKEWNVQKDKDFTGVALGQVFAHIHVHWFFCSHPEIFVEGFELLDGENRICPSITAAPSKITSPLYSGVDQMDTIQKFRLLVSDLILNCTACEFEIGPASSIGRSAAIVLNKLRLCRSRLTDTLVELDGLAPEDCDNIKACSLWIGIIEIKLAVAESPNPDEMVYDNHLEQFQHITNIARILADSATRSSDTEFSPFSYRYSVLPALLWSAAKCRDWRVRRDICFIMHKRPGDDYWVSATTLALKRLIDVESIEVKPGEIIPESARAYWVKVKIQSEKSRVELRYRRPRYGSQSRDDGEEWERDSTNY